MGGDALYVADGEPLICFNPRPRMGGDNGCLLCVLVIFKFQSTPPHGGRLLLWSHVFMAQGVSIHAPAWGATCASLQVVGMSIVSIHAPAWGATYPLYWNAPYSTFQSTPPHGGRRRHGRDPDRHGWFQSTPPHGGRLSVLCLLTCQACFNPRPRMGGDLPCWLQRCSAMFQSTPPHGGRRNVLTVDKLKGSFNPRPRMGGDLE